MKNNNFRKRVFIVLSSLGPGIFLVGYNIGTGSVTTMASAGAKYGTGLLWAVLISCLFTFFLIFSFGQYTLITGQTALQSFKQNFGTVTAKVVLWSLIISEMVSSVGVMAVVTEVVHEYSKMYLNDGQAVDQVLISAFIGVSVVAILFNGKYSLLEKILIVFVTVMGLSFVLSSLMIVDQPAEVIAGMIPKLPAGADAGLIVSGMIGTTMGGVLYVVRSSTIKEKNWDLSHLKNEKRDALISAGLMFILSAAIMGAAAGTLYPLGLEVNNAIDMVKLLEPLAGSFAVTLFVGGLVAAGLSSLLPHYILVPMLLADYNNEKLDLSTRKNRLIVIFYASLGLVVPILGGRPVLVMIASQSLALLATPLILLLMWIQFNSRSALGNRTFSLPQNLLMGLITIFTILVSILGFQGIFDLFSSL